MKDLMQKSLWRASLVYAYALLGGCMFYLIERTPEKNKDIFARLSLELRQNVTTKFNISINESDFQRFMQRTFEVVRVGNKPDWTILTGLSFSMTTLATVGYGHITPETPLGQTITVLYSFVGLPISVLTLKTLGEVVSNTVNAFIYMMETRVLCRKRPRRVKIKTFFTTFTLMILTLCIGGLAQVYLEGWSFVEGFYAWFATLSTIGYGDYVPYWSLMMKANEEESQHSKIRVGLIMSASALPSLAALSVVSGVINSLVEAIEEFKLSFKTSHQCPRCEKNESETEMVNIASGSKLTKNSSRERSATL